MEETRAITLSLYRPSNYSSGKRKRVLRTGFIIPKGRIECKKSYHQSIFLLKPKGFEKCDEAIE
jgi:hypothetical protein